MTLRYRPLLERRLAGDACPTAPVLFWKHHPVADQDGAALCRATLDFQDRFDCDVVKISPAATYQLPDYGLRDAWLGDSNGRRAVTATVVHAPEDWLRLPRLDPGRGFIARFGECLAMVRREVPPEVPVIITVFDPMIQAVFLAGREAIDAHLRDAPDAVAAGLNRITENTVELINHLRGAGADGIFLACQYATRDDLPLHLFERHAMPTIRDCLDVMAGAPVNMVHVHGAGIHDEPFARLDGVTIHYDMWADNPAPTRFLDAGCAVATGPSPALLASDAPDEEVAAACAVVLDTGGRTILSPGCSVPLAVDAQRLQRISTAARLVSGR